MVSGGDMEYFKTAPLTNTVRPDWDVRILNHLGMHVEITEDIGRFVYEEWEKDLYGESPLFEVCAVKSVKTDAEKNMWSYWQKRAESFGMDSSGKGIQNIQERFRRYLPEGSAKVLDIGTGTGIIAISLSMMGHEVTAVDLCTNMLEKAGENARTYGQQISMLCASADELPFEDDSFDVIVSRNVTWALAEPEKAFLSWKRVLKPGGLLVYLDANHYYYLFNEEDQKNRERIIEINGSAHMQDRKETYDYSLCDQTALELPMSRFNRPREWDEVNLPRFGFQIINKEVSYPQKLLKYGIGKGYYTEFLIAAMNEK